MEQTIGADLTSADIELLGRAYMREIDSALRGGPYVIQSRSKKLAKRADKLIEYGYLRRTVENWKGVRLVGYALTHMGRWAYCARCGEQRL